MAFRLATAAIEFVGQDRRLISTLDGIRTRLRSLIKTALRFGTVLVAAIGVRKAIQLAQEQARAEANLIAVLAQTGEAAGFTAKQLTQIASALQEITTFGDEAIISAQGLLASFTNIRGEQFIRTLAVALDRAALKGVDATTIVEQFGKAINDPIKGIKLLNESGITLNDTQRKQIDNFLRVNNIIGAQNVFLKELESRFGGVATAFAKTPTGKLIQLGNVIGDVTEQFGLGFAEAVEKAFDSVQGFLKRVGPVVRGIGTFLGRVISLIIRGIEAAVSGAAKALGLDKLKITAEKVALFIEIAFLKIEKGVVSFVGFLISAVQQIINAFTLIADALDQIPGIAIDSSGLQAFTRELDVFIKGFGERKKEIDKQISALGTDLIKSVAKDKIAELAELLGFKKREKPPIKFTRPKAEAEKAIRSVGLEAPEQTFKRLQAFVLKKPEDESVKAQKEGNAIAQNNVDANKAVEKAVDENREGVTQTLVDLGTKLQGLFGFGAGTQK